MPDCFEESRGLAMDTEKFLSYIKDLKKQQLKGDSCRKHRKVFKKLEDALQEQDK